MMQSKIMTIKLMSQPAWAKAAGIVKAPVPTMRLKRNMKPVYTRD